MAVVLTNGSSGGLFDRLGAIGGGIADIHALLGAAATARVLSGANWATRAANLDAYYGASPAQRKVVDGLFQAVAGWQQSQSGLLSQLRTYAQNTVIEMVHADSPLPSKTLANALAILIAQMTASGDDVNASAPSVGSQTAVGSPTGDPAIVVSVKRPTGRLAEYAFAETLRFACTGDAGLGSTEFREPFTVTSPQAVADSLAYDWPGGSGISKTLTAVDYSLDASTNLLTNSSFDAFTSNTPDDWTALVGAAGTDILAGGSGEAHASSGNALRFTYDAGTPLSSIAQIFGTDTTATLKPNTVYLFNAWMKKTSGLSGAGTVAIDLVNGSNSVISDDQSNANTISQVASSLTTSYTKVSGSFVTPRLLSGSQKLRVRLSTAIAQSGQSVYIDSMSLVEGTELYSGGPYAAVFSGATAPVRGDTWTVALSQTWGEFQKLLQRLFDLRSLNLHIPSDSGGSETLADSLIL